MIFSEYASPMPGRALSCSAVAVLMSSRSASAALILAGSAAETTASFVSIGIRGTESSAEASRPIETVHLRSVKAIVTSIQLRRFILNLLFDKPRHLIKSGVVGYESFQP